MLPVKNVIYVSPDYWPPSVSWVEEMAFVSSLRNKDEKQLSFLIERERRRRLRYATWRTMTREILDRSPNVFEFFARADQSTPARLRQGILKRSSETSTDKRGSQLRGKSIRQANIATVRGQSKSVSSGRNVTSHVRVRQGSKRGRSV
jgi:hypothetical protein